MAQFEPTAPTAPLRYFQDWLDVLSLRTRRAGDYLTAFSTAFDASGDFARPVLTVAGFLSTPDRWERFTDEWSVLMDEWDLPYFHMAQFNAAKGPYEAWSATQRDERLMRLIDVTLAHTLGSVGVSFHIVPFEQEVPNPIARYVGDRYGVASHHCIRESANLVRDTLRIPGEHQVHHIFEAGDVGMGRVSAIAAYEQKDEDRRKALLLGSVTHDTKLKQVPLQAADILAWELGRLAHRPDERRSSTQRLAEQPHRWFAPRPGEMGRWVLPAQAMFVTGALGPVIPPARRSLRRSTHGR